MASATATAVRPVAPEPVGEDLLVEVARRAGLDLAGATSLQLLHRGDDHFHRLLTVVAAARREVFVEMPVLRRDLAERLGRLDPGARFARAHRDAIRRQLGTEPAPPGGACPRLTDLLWTKPSELVFYAGLGLATLLDRPVGEHEGRNRSWLLARGAALEAPAPQQAAEWLVAHLTDGSLATAAWRGFAGVPRRGLYRVVEALAREGFTAP